MEMGQRRNRRDERDDLRYTMQKNDGSDKHIEERIKRAIVAMKPGA